MERTASDTAEGWNGGRHVIHHGVSDNVHPMCMAGFHHPAKLVLGP